MTRGGFVSTRFATGVAAALTALFVFPGPSTGTAPQQDLSAESPVATRVWLDQGEAPVLRPGERVRVYVRTDVDAEIAVFHVDPLGHVDLVFPEGPSTRVQMRGGVDHRLVIDRSSYWLVGEGRGMGYFVAIAIAVAAHRPLDFAALDRGPRGGAAGGWHARAVSSEVYEDPWLAVDDLVAALIPDWDVVDFAVDVSEYHVGEWTEAPRFTCSGCHERRPGSWSAPVFFGLPLALGRRPSGLRHPAGGGPRAGSDRERAGRPASVWRRSLSPPEEGDGAEPAAGTRRSGGLLHGRRSPEGARSDPSRAGSVGRHGGPPSPRVLRRRAGGP